MDGRDEPDRAVLADVVEGVGAHVHEALDRARAAAGGGRVDIAGGAATVRQYLVAGLLDELLLHVVPVVLGRGSGCSTAWATSSWSRSGRWCRGG